MTKTSQVSPGQTAVESTSVCFVVTEILGTVRNGGIATAITHMSLLLSKLGYRTEVLYCGWQSEVEAVWAKRYREAGVTVRLLDRSEEVAPDYVADTWRVYRELAGAQHDIVIFQDWQGLGAVSGLAKHVGLAFGATRLIHHVHGPTEWLLEANRTVDLFPRDAAVAHLERLSAQYADEIVGPSSHLIEWMDCHGWSLAESRRVIPYFTSRHLENLAAELPPDPPTAPLAELVFFGRLEERKGVRTFASAINRLDPEMLRGIKITFMGRPAHFQPQDVVAMFEPGARAALEDIQFLTDLDQPEARAYLRGPGRVAVVPSFLDNSPNVVYECIEDRIPFLASHAGGTGELVAPEDRAYTLFDPTPASLASILLPLLESRLTPRPARPSYDGPELLAAWEPILTATGDEHNEQEIDSRPVTVVIPHHDRPDYLLGAVRSAIEQDHANLEVVVVDDGSRTPAAHRLLERLPTMFGEGRVRVIRQENRYLGAARNAGARAATADWLVFLDDDDELHPSAVSEMLRAQRRTDARLVSVGFDVVDGARLEHPRRLHTWIFLGSGIHLGSMMNNLGGAGMLVSRDDLLRLGGFHEQHGVGHEDWRLYVQFMLGGLAITSVPEPLYIYRIRANSMIRSTSTYANAETVNEAFRTHLPPELSSWPFLLRAMSEVITRQQGEAGNLHHRIGLLEHELATARRLLDLRRQIGWPR